MHTHTCEINVDFCNSLKYLGSKYNNIKCFGLSKALTLRVFALKHVENNNKSPAITSGKHLHKSQQQH